MINDNLLFQQVEQRGSGSAAIVAKDYAHRRLTRIFQGARCVYDSDGVDIGVGCSFLGQFDGGSIGAVEDTLRGGDDGSRRRFLRRKWKAMELARGEDSDVS